MRHSLPDPRAREVLLRSHLTASLRITSPHG